MKFQTSVAVAAVALFTLAACGTGAVPTGVSNPTASPAGPIATPSSAPTASIPAAPPTSTTTPVGAVDLCALLSVDDLVTVLDGGHGWVNDGLSKPGPTGYCHWDTRGEYNPTSSVITFTDDRPLATIKSGGNGVDMTVSGHAGYSVRDDQGFQTTWVDLGGLLLVVEFPQSSNADDDQAAAQALAEIAVGNM